MAVNDSSEKAFSLAPAIFTPFTGILPASESEPSREQKLEKIIANLDKQHELVRKNMSLMIQAQADSLTKQAKDELADLEREGEDPCVLDDEVKARRREDEEAAEEILKSIRVPMKEGAKSVDYAGILDEDGKWHWPGSVEASPAVNNNNSKPGEDVEMSGMDTVPRKRTARAINEELNVALMELVNDGIAEMVRYDTHAAETRKFYEDALQRAKARFGDTPSKEPETGTSKTGTVGGGILRNRNEESRVDKEVLRRMESEKETLPKPVRDPGWVDPRFRK